MIKIGLLLTFDDQWRREGRCDICEELIAGKNFYVSLPIPANSIKDVKVVHEDCYKKKHPE